MEEDVIKQGMENISPNKRTTEFLNKYVDLPDPRYAVMLTGTWGCGKTFFIKSWKEQLEKKIDSDKTSTLTKPVYVSLFGLSSIQEINDAITKEVYPILESRIYKLGKLALKAVSSVTLQCDITKLGENDLTKKASMKIDLVSLFKSGFSEDGKPENRIIIFDDFERCKVSCVDLLGYINLFVEHSNVRVIILCHEEEIKSEEKEDYARFKEKLIGRTFRIFPDISAAIVDFCNQPGIVHLDDNQKYTVREAFETAGYYNLRPLWQALQDFSSLKLDYDPAVCRHQELYNRFLIQFVVAYCEYFSNKKVRDLATVDPVMLNLLDNNPYDRATNEEKKVLNNKYNNLSLQRSNYLFDGKMQFILQSIVDGSDISGFLNYELNPVGDLDSMQFKLLDYPYLENDELESLYSRALGYIIDENTNILTCFSIVGVFAMLEIDDVCRTSETTISICQENCLKRVSKTNDVALLMSYLSRIEKHEPIISYNKTRRCHRKWFVDFRHSIMESIRDRIKELCREKAQDLLNINNNNFDETKKKVFYVNDSGGASTMIKTPIFQNVNPEIFSKVLCSLSNKNKNAFGQLLSERYGIILDAEYSEEINNLKEISNKIRRFAIVRSDSARNSLQQLSEKFKEAAEKIESIVKIKEEIESIVNQFE